MLEYLVVPIEWKADSAEGGASTLVGYASTFGNVDLGGDVVMPGAFTKSIQTIKANGIPLLADHMASTAALLGTIYDAQEDTKGLIIRARISQAPSAQDTAVKLREGHLSKLSIGYETMEDAYVEMDDGRKVRELRDVKLWETSVVVFPMNPAAAISRVKSLVDALAPEQRKDLYDTLVEAERAVAGVVLDDPPKQADTVGVSTQGGSSEPDTQGGDHPAHAPEAASRGDGGTPNAGGEPAPAPGEGASGYDRFASRAILHDRPLDEVDPVERASLMTRLALAESQAAVSR